MIKTLSRLLLLTAAVTEVAACGGDPAREDVFSSRAALVTTTPDARIKIPLPPGISPAELRSLSPAARARINAAVHQRLGGLGVTGTPEADHLDALIVLVDEQGAPLAPDREAASSLAPAATQELTFTFDSPDVPWTDEELSNVKAWEASCYPIIKTVYGPPAFSNVVNVSKSTDTGFDGTYSSSTNEIQLSTIEGAVLCHEMIHAFHDDDNSSFVSFEEGMTRAAEIEVTKRAGIPDSVDHTYYYDVFYSELNKPVVGAVAGEWFFGWSQVLLRYQLGGYAWGKAFLESASFFTKFNAALYSQAATDPSVLGNESALVGLAAAARSTVEGQAFKTWYAQQYVLDTSPPVGNLIYLRVDTPGLVFVLNRSAQGPEQNLANIPVTVAYSDSSGKSLGSASGTTNANGFAEAVVSLPPSYSGRVTMAASAKVGSSTLKTTGYLKSGPSDGVFGIVTGTTSGTIAFKPLDGGSAVTVPVKNAGFDAPSLASVQGRIQYTIKNSSGTSRSAKIFTKAGDAPYFLHVVF